jgi:hypothetical protein
MIDDKNKLIKAGNGSQDSAILVYVYDNNIIYQGYKNTVNSSMNNKYSINEGKQDGKRSGGND